MKPASTLMAALMAVLLISGCSGITPDGEIRNNREEGPESGLFTGAKGEFTTEISVRSSTDKKAKKIEDEDKQP